MNLFKKILAFPLRVLVFIVTPLMAIIYGLIYAWEEDSMQDFFENFWRCFSRITWTLWHRVIGYIDAGYYRLHKPKGGCGPWTWFAKKPQDPDSGEKWRLSNGYTYGGL